MIGTLVAAGLLPAVASASYKGSPGYLVTESGGDIVRVDHSGNLFPLATGAESYSPSVSPDGTKVAYIKNVPDPGRPPNGTQDAVWVVNMDGTNAHQLTQPPPGRNQSTSGTGCGGSGPDLMLTYEYSYSDAGEPSWSPDGKQVVFVRQFSGDRGTQDACTAPVGCDATYVSQPYQNLWTVNVDANGNGSGQRAFTTDTRSPEQGGTSYDGPAWSSNGGVIAERVTQTGCATQNPQFQFELDEIGGGGRVTLPVNDQDVLNYDPSPDGTQVAVLLAGANGAPNHVAIVNQSGNLTDHPEITTMYRYSTDGNGLITDGCVTGDDGQQRCGLVIHRLPDPGGDVRDSDPPDKFLAPTPDFDSGSPRIGGTRPTIDVQPQHLPVILVPGFLGSEIACRGETEWFAFPPDYLGMRLATDGATNAGCPDSKPTGQPVRSIGPIDAGPTDVYGHIADYVESHFTYADGASRGYVLGWDWRLNPQANLDRLSIKINEALSSPEARAEGASQVVLYGHSYGGLLIRWYLADPARAQHVAQVLTAGTPYWGSPKSMFPVAYGIETPLSSPLDAFGTRADMREFSRNLTGLYQFLPSDSFGGWLAVDGKLQKQDGVSAFIGSVGGNRTLLAAGRANHQSTYDHFFDDNGRIDIRVVVGTGQPSIGAVDVTHPDPQDNTQTIVKLGYVTGDGTVPGRSAWTGDVGQLPAGDPHHRVHMQAVCGIGHVALPASESILTAYTDFLDWGHRPRQLPPPCSLSGEELDFNFNLNTGASRDLAGAHATAARGDGSLSLVQAEAQGRADVMRLPGQTIVTTDSYHPVKLRVDRASHLTFTVTPLSDAGGARPMAFGPVNGRVVIAPGRGYPTVTANGRRARGRLLAAGQRLNPPLISRLKIRPTTVRRGGRLIVTYRDSARGHATVTIARQVPGVLRSGTCVAGKAGGRPGRPQCTRDVTVVTVRRPSRRGANRLTIVEQTLARLRAGTYTLSVTPTNAAGVRGTATTGTWRIH